MQTADQNVADMFNFFNFNFNFIIKPVALFCHFAYFQPDLSALIFFSQGSRRRVSGVFTFEHIILSIIIFFLKVLIQIFYRGKTKTIHSNIMPYNSVSPFLTRGKQNVFETDTRSRRHKTCALPRSHSRRKHVARPCQKWLWSSAIILFFSNAWQTPHKIPVFLISQFQSKF